jgi:hypothetical protein
MKYSAALLLILVVAQSSSYAEDLRKFPGPVPKYFDKDKFNKFKEHSITRAYAGLVIEAAAWVVAYTTSRPSLPAASISLP